MRQDHLHIVSLNHRNAPISRVGSLHVPEERQEAFLNELKNTLGVQGLAYLTTCNRVEFILVDEAYFCMGRLQQLFQAFAPDDAELRSLMGTAMVLHGEDAARHLLRVSAGLESMVLGEREILTQIRSALERSRQWGLAGDQLRITERIAIETAKQVFTETDIARRSVSVNALGWKAFQEQSIPKEAPILLIGAGQTNGNIARFLAKQGYASVHILNRTAPKAEALAAPRNWTWGDLSGLEESLAKGPAAIFLCTGSDTAILDEAQAQALPAGQVFVLDLSVPSGVTEAFRKRPNCMVVGIAELKPLADENVAGRRAALGDCQRIINASLIELTNRLQQREVELALRELPTLLAAVRNTALGEVFADELAELDGETRSLVDRIVAYLEKKYVSVPMKLAREAVMEHLDKP
ncbi:MAG TPA: hypothetical protein DHV07_07295 [Flavobacteriales bacterium]|nr:hypothetical protein [Flavobacteriales bacterium]